MSYQEKQRTKIEDLQQPTKTENLSSEVSELIDLSDEQARAIIAGRMVFCEPCSCTTCNDVDYC